MTHALLSDALKSDIEDAGVFNNLAWEFALRKVYPLETLAAALRAHELDSEDANIMDTVAEAYYAKGDFEHAIQYEEEALKREPENQFFTQQLEKFKKALEGK
jgi:tetratricopeptide (TPR) repeat protein